MLLTVLSALGINIEAPEFFLKVQGDDGIVAFCEMVLLSDPNFLNKMAHEAKVRFNAVISPEKTTHGSHPSDVEVLSYRNREGLAYRAEAELLAHLLYPERSRGPAELAASCIGIAYAAMGSSRTVYAVCKDVFDFLTTKLKVKPDFREWKWMDQSFIQVPHSSGRFPSHQETFLQNFILEGRSEQMKQRLWPTKPTGDFGFHFLLS